MWFPFIMRNSEQDMPGFEHGPAWLLNQRSVRSKVRNKPQYIALLFAIYLYIFIMKIKIIICFPILQITINNIRLCSNMTITTPHSLQCRNQHPKVAKFGCK